MKKIVLILLTLCIVQLTQAQQAGKFRMGLDLGPAIPQNGGIGALASLEPRINVSDNFNVGLRIGVAALAKDLTLSSPTDEYTGELAANASIGGTVDYYFNNGQSNFAPYIGGGFGYYGLGAVDIDSGSVPDEDLGELETTFKWAPMVRAGIELGKFRLGAEYNIVPKSNLQDLSGQVIGEAVNQYFGFVLGVYVGGGRWRKI